MATAVEPVEINIPSLPAKHDHFIQYISEHADKPLLELVEPYKKYDAELRKAFAQQPSHSALKEPNIVPIFTGHEQDVKIRARDLSAESQNDKDCYIMPLKDDNRRADGSPAIVQSLREFKDNFTVFSESSLVDMDWSNVVVAGSAVVSSLLAVPEEHSGSKRALRQYYHEVLSPASDVDLFLYGLTEEEALAKIKQIEGKIRDALLVETTTIRTKNTITIASRHPVRHVQIVLRLYRSMSEILTGFDVDCSCACYDGNQVYASPRALCSYMTQINTIDLTRRSPSYEMRLSKYARRGFEVYWPSLDRSRIDPTIFERSFARTEGLARLLILEKLPKNQDREAYLDQRREERGRPAVNRYRMRRRMVYGDIKNNYEDEISEALDEDASNYHTISIPYGPKFHARKIEKLLYTKDLLLNAEWNRPKDREVNLHRHPAFFGTAEEVMQDCCGYCPAPVTVEEEEVAEEESKTFVSGNISFMKDDPGRQAIGSFNPVGPEEWTTMAYVGNTALFCQAIVDGDLEYVQSWLQQDGNDVNARDYTGRAPLHLAATNSTPEVVQALIDHGARIVARLVDGRTALHLAAMRGSVEIVSALLRKSAANDEIHQENIDARRAARKADKQREANDVAMSDPGQDNSDVDDDVDMMDDAADDNDIDATTESSMVNIKSLTIKAGSEDDPLVQGNDKEEDPDIYDVDVVAWDTAVSALHLAIVQGHVDVVKCLVSEHGADLLLPVKLFHDHDKSARAAILTLVLAMQLPEAKADEMGRILIDLGASSAQASIDQSTAFQTCVGDRPDLLDALFEYDPTGAKRAINHFSVSDRSWTVKVAHPLMTAIAAKDSSTALSLLNLGAKAEVDFSTYMRAYESRHDVANDSKHNKRIFEENQEQPVITAVKLELPLLAKSLVEDHAVSVNTLTLNGHQVLNNKYSRYNTEGSTLLDQTRQKLESLRKWQHKPDEPEAPMPLQDDATYLKPFKEGTYAFWSAENQVHDAKKTYKEDLKRYEKDLERSKDRTGVSEKQQAIDHLAADFEQLEASLVHRDAKTFKELHPEVEDPDGNRNYGFHQSPNEPKAFEVELKFQLGDLTDQSQERYEKLFEAAWNGDVKSVKTLTLTPWTEDEEEERPPSKIAVQDQFGLSPFSIAVVRGHLELARVILEIAQAQHVTQDGPKQRRYILDGGDEDESYGEDDDDDNEDEELPLFSEVVDDTFTLESVGEVSVQVQSRVTPLQMLQWRCPSADLLRIKTETAQASGSNGFSYFGPRKGSSGKRTNTGSIKLPTPPASSSKPHKEVRNPADLIEYALFWNEHNLLSFLLDLCEKYQVPDEEDPGRAFQLPKGTFDYALEVGHTHLVAELMKRTGAGIPLQHLANKFGIALREKPKYYQGLSVYGKKRKDWADAGRHYMGNHSGQNRRVPFLESAHNLSLDLVEWFLSDGPHRAYKEFSESHQEDKRVKRLVSSKTGFESCVDRFLSSRSQLAMHLCIIGDPTVESERLLQFLIEVVPDTIESKSVDGFTPLQIAFKLWREDHAKILIDAGAAMYSRNKVGENLVHSLLSQSVTKKEYVEKLRRMLNLIDKRLLPSMFLERSIGSLTPLHSWLTKFRHAHYDFDTEVLQLILQHSGGEELSLISGEGDTPLHHAVKVGNPGLARVLLEHNPSLLYRENATGRTPYEMGEDAAIARMCSNPPPMPAFGHINHEFRSRKAIRQGLSRHWADDILKRPLHDFTSEGCIEQKGDREILWDILQEAKAKIEAEGNVKRTLVTLNEANEVAKRLAEMKARSGQNRHRNGGYDDFEDQADEDDEETRDEVSMYLNRAKVG